MLATAHEAEAGQLLLQPPPRLRELLKIRSVGRVAAANQSSGGESKRESSINDKQASFRQAFFEPGREPLGYEIEVDHIGHGRDARCRCEDRLVLPLCPLQQMLTESLVQNRPEYGCGMMYYITGNSVSETEVILERSVSSPDPLAGTI